MSNMPPNLALGDAMVSMVEGQRQGLDDLFKQDIKEKTTNILRLESMLSTVKSIIEELPSAMPEVGMPGRAVAKGITYGS